MSIRATSPEARAPHPASLALTDLLRVMALSREGDRREGILHRQGKGWFQLPGAGHEAIAAIAYCLTPDDYLFAYYRDRALLLARGVPNYDIALDYFAKAASSSGGAQLASHFSDHTRRIVSVASPVGLQCLPAAGTAWAARLEASQRVVVCAVGDAALRQGEFFEALCFALEKSLPLIFLIEDNGYGISTPTARMNPWNIGALSGKCLVRIDGRDVEQVFLAGRQAVERARSGGGPTVIWAEVDRLLSHTSSDDHRAYRAADELEAIAARDPITCLRNRLVWEGQLTTQEWDASLKEIAGAVDKDYQRASRAADPCPGSAANHVLAPASGRSFNSELPAQETWTMVAALNHTLRQALSRDDRVILFGEDIEDPKGGVFGLTRGLSTSFPERVFNSPLAEATIAGVAAGLAIAGFRPVFELQFIDFAPPAFNQIVNQIATLRWRSNGAWKCPLVLIAPCGAYLPSGGPWHSQTNESWFAHAPGIRVAMPGNPQDASAILNAAIEGDDPTLILLPKHLFRKRIAMQPETALRFGEAAVVRHGSDVTVVAWGNCVEVAASAADSLTDEISVDLIDMRTIVPCDWAAIRNSLLRTGRLVVVQEDNRSCSFGQAILAEMTSRPDCWDLFAAPPQLVSRPDVHVGYNALLEQEVLPNPDRVREAIRFVMNY